MPGRGQVKVAVRVASLNFFDILMVQGLYQRRPPFPFVAGSDAAGDVIAVGPDVRDIRVGDRVMVFNWSGGAFAEEMIVPQTNAFVLPASVSYPAAAALKSVYGTALYALRDRARLETGETLLVLGAAGGVGLALLEVGQLVGARVIAAVGSETKAELVRGLNVDQVINYSTESLRDRVRDFTGGKGADVVMDPVGGDIFDQAQRAVSWGGRLCILGFTSGRIPQLAVNQVLLKSFNLVGVNYGGWVDHEPEAHRREAQQLIDWCAVGKITPAYLGHAAAWRRRARRENAARPLSDRQSPAHDDS